MSDDDMKARASGQAMVPAASKKTEALSLLNGMESALGPVLPPGTSLARFKRVAANALIANPDLMTSCDRMSLARAIIRCGELGLDIGHGVAMVPFKGKVQLLIEYTGKIALAVRYGNVKHVADPSIVFSDEYETYHDEHGPHFKFRPSYPSPSQALAAGLVPIGVLVQIQMNDGSWRSTFVDTDRILRAQAASPKNAEKYDPKHPEWVPFWKKTAIHEAMKYLAKTPKFEDAIAADGVVVGATEAQDYRQLPHETDSGQDMGYVEEAAMVYEPGQDG